LQLAPLSGWQAWQTGPFPRFVERWLDPPPSHPLRPCGVFHPWQGEQDWPDDPPRKSEPWQMPQ
jgi:hypothetical protein